MRETSAALYERARGLLPGGVNSPVRAMRSIGRDPIFIASGSGAELTDVEGKRYIDYVCSWGPLVAGHAHPSVIDAVTRAASLGTSFGAPTPGEVDLAAAIVDRVPSAEMVRMTSSGTEASMSAIRLARAATGRDPILKFSGAYHGHVDGLLADAGSGLATQGIPASPGVTRAAANDTEIVPWNNRDAVQEALDARPPAAIILEPAPANMGLVPPQDGFLEFLREAATASGALLIFDEVISGFRVARGGMQERSGITPDLTVLGKIIGGGLPAAAYAGRADLMERIAPSGDVYQAGTLSGNPLAVAAGKATLDLLDSAAYRQLDETTTALADGIETIAQDAGVAVQVPRVTGLFTIFFSDAPVTDYEGAKAADAERYGAFCRALLDRGVYPPASQFEAWFPSLAHTADHVEQTLAAISEAFAAIAGVQSAEGRGR